MPTAREIINHLGLQPHPNEGGVLCGDLPL